MGFPEWTAQFSVWKTTGKDSSEACAITCQNFAVYSVFLSGMTSHSKIAQFNWECIGRFRLKQQIRPAFRGPFGRTQHVSCVLLKWLLKVLTIWHGFGVKIKFNNMIIPITTSDQDMIQWQTTISTQQTKLQIVIYQWHIRLGKGWPTYSMLYHHFT